MKYEEFVSTLQRIGASKEDSLKQVLSKLTAEGLTDYVDLFRTEFNVEAPYIDFMEYAVTPDTLATRPRGRGRNFCSRCGYRLFNNECPNCRLGDLAKGTGQNRPLRQGLRQGPRDGSGPLCNPITAGVIVDDGDVKVTTADVEREHVDGVIPD